MKVELGLSNYAIKADFKNATGVDTSKLAEKVDLANSKKLNITQKLVKLKIKLLLIMIMINISLLKNLISYHQKILLQD